MTPTDSTAITRVCLRNYKSIAACDVELPSLTFLVGPNGSGKSNFLDALRFTAQALRFSPEHALRERGGINEVRRRSRGHPNHFAIRVRFHVPNATGWYAFEIGARPKGRYFVRREQCVVRAAEPERCGFFRIEDGEHRGNSIPHPPPTGGSDRLYLLPASGYKAFRPVYDTLSGMGFYNLNPAQIRELQSPDPGDLLDRDGGNIASVLDRMKSHSPSDVGRIGDYLSRVVPGTNRVEPRTIGPKLTLEFRQQVRGDPNPWRFLANNVSDGTLRVLGVLAALFQRPGASRSARLVGIEEPETALHPAAAGVLADILHEPARSGDRQQPQRGPAGPKDDSVGIDPGRRVGRRRNESVPTRRGGTHHPSRWALHGGRAASHESDCARPGSAAPNRSGGPRSGFANGWADAIARQPTRRH